MTRPTPSHFALQRLALAGLLCCLSGLLALAMPSPALAACAGNTNVETETALNDAIAAFNSGGAGCEFTITFMNDISLSGSTTPISNSGAGSKLLIEGNGNVLNGQGTSGVRPFQVVANTVVAMNHITITGGMVSSSGGGILNGGFLTIQDSTISSNEVNGNAVGGGISNSGTLIVTRSTIAGNRIRTGNSGGGIFNSGTATVTNSTISDNQILDGFQGHAIYNEGTASLTIVNSTIADNETTQQGVALYNKGNLTLANTIFANGPNGIDCGGTFTEPVTGDFNLFEDISPDACGLINGIDGNIVGEDPNLGPLQDNGGPTLTHALLIPSPAIEAGSNELAVDGDGVTLTTDQRGVGYPRAIGTVDMGAFEQPCPVSVSVGDESTLNDAITCFNNSTVSGSYTITLSNDIRLTGDTTTIDNATADVVLLIDGNGKTLDGNNAYRPLDIAANTTVTVQNLTITQGKGEPAGGRDGGGAIRNAGDLTITSSTLSNNKNVNPSSVGGGVYNNGGTVTIVNSTLSGNTTTEAGGGVFNTGTLSITNSTLSGNVAGEGGGVYNEGGTVTITNSTLRGNNAFNAVGNNGGAVTINNSIITASPGFDCAVFSGGSFSGSSNLIDDFASGPCAGISDAAVTGLNNTLADNGGPTLTHALLTGSNAINAGDNGLAVDAKGAALTTDQRGLSRFIGSVDVGAVESEFGCSSFPVDVDTFPATVDTERALNLFIDCFNGIAAPGSYTINLSANIDLTASTTVINNSTAGVKLMIEGNGFKLDGKNMADVRPLDIAVNTTVAIQNLTVTGGNVAGNGGGIRNAGFLTVQNSTITSNRVSDDASTGGGIWNSKSLVVIDSTVSGNQANNDGGIRNWDQSSETTIINSTISGNVVVNTGAGITNFGQMTVTNSTIADNSATLGVGGGILNNLQLTLNNSIIANNTAKDGVGADCVPDRGLGTVTAAFSLIEADQCDLGDGIGNIIGQDPNLGPLQNNGGPTLTYALLINSPAVEAGSNELAVDGDGVTLTTDQRGVGFPRLAGATVDMGAFERQSCIFPTSVGDEAALNDAITCFNAITVPSSYTIKLSDNIVDSIVLTGDTTTIDNAAAGVTLLIDGNGKTLDGNDAYRPLDIAANTTVAIQNLTVTGGNVNNSGGGVQNLGDLTITNSTLSGNRATTGGGAVRNAGGGTLTIVNSTLGSNTASFGGGVTNAGTLTITGSTLSGNSASDSGGGVFIGGGGDLTLANSTLSGNSASRDGGGVYIGGGGDLTITNSTLSGNGASGEGGGVYEASGTVTLNNAIITNSTSGGDCAIFDGIEFSGSSNLIDDTTGPCAGATFRLGAVTNFETTLGDNGGPTLTHALLTGSNAINAIPLSVARLDGTQSANVVCDGLVPDTDQRGVTRPQGSGCDIGAFELANPLAVTLGWFLAERNGASVNFRWQTATETGTAGFHVLAATDDGNTVQLNQKLIPSLVIDSITPTDYAFNAVTDATGFYLEEMGVDGGVTRHGPFELGVEYGAYALPGNVEVRPAVFLPVVAR